MIQDNDTLRHQTANDEPYYDERGVWVCLNADSVAKARNIQTPRPALFLDRDGVINIDVNYLSKIEDVALHDGATSLIAQANNADIPVIVITNQSGVGRGYFDWDTLWDVQVEIARQLGQEHAHWDGVFACPFHADGQTAYRHKNHPFRKPNTGMITMAAEIFAIDLSRSWIIGDKASDLQAGINAGMAGGIHVYTRYQDAAPEREKVSAMATADFTVMTAKTVLEASRMINLSGL